MGMRIGSVAEAAGVEVSTVRYYERRGLLADPPRSDSGYRQYDESVIDRIRFVRQAQDLGFTLEEIEELLDLRVEDRSSCGAVEEATRHRPRSDGHDVNGVRYGGPVAAERVEGVREAEFSYPEGTGVVTYDATVTSDSVIIAEVERDTGFGLVVREPGTSGS